MKISAIFPDFGGMGLEDLLLAQCAEGMGSGGAAGRYITGQQTDSREQERHCQKHNRIPWIDAYQLASEHR